MGIFNPFRLLDRRAKEVEEQRARIAFVAEAGDVRALVELLPFLPPETHRLGPDAAKAADSVLARCSPVQLAWFDQWYREGWGPKGPDAPAWRDVRLGPLSWARQFRGVVALASFHGNGFVREIAVRLLGSFDDGFELPYLLIRTNDWVPKVRVAAATAALHRVGPSYVEHWIRCLGLLERLRSAERRDRDDAVYVRRVEQLLLHADSRASLQTALSAGDLTTRRAALRLAELLPPAERHELLTTAVLDVDPRIAIQAARGLLASPSPGDSSAIHPQLLQHRLGKIRSLALTAAVEHDLPSSTDWLERALLDDARCVREVARFELSKGAGAPRDFASWYRARLSATDPRLRVIALEGLAEIGTREDVPVFLPLLRAPNARVRAAAIAGIGRCQGDRHHDELEAALRDPSSMVRRAATPFAKLHSGKAFVQRLRRESREPPARRTDAAHSGVAK